MLGRGPPFVAKLSYATALLASFSMTSVEKLARTWYAPHTHDVKDVIWKLKNK